MDELAIRVRFYNKEKDEAFVYSSWCNQAYYSAFKKPSERPQTFFNKQTAKIKAIIDDPHVMVLIACLDEDPQVIIGYSVSSATSLEWIYVKEAFRKIGVAKLLIPMCVLTFSSPITKIGKVIAEKKNLIIKGENNG